MSTKSSGIKRKRSVQQRKMERKKMMSAQPYIQIQKKSCWPGEKPLSTLYHIEILKKKMVKKSHRPSRKSERMLKQLNHDFGLKNLKPTVVTLQQLNAIHSQPNTSRKNQENSLKKSSPTEKKRRLNLKLLPKKASNEMFRNPRIVNSLQQFSGTSPRTRPQKQSASLKKTLVSRPLTSISKKKLKIL